MLYYAINHSFSKNSNYISNLTIYNNQIFILETFLWIVNNTDFFESIYVSWEPNIPSLVNVGSSVNNIYIYWTLLSVSSLSYYKIQVNVENLALLILVHIANDRNATRHRIDRFEDFSDIFV